MTALALVFDTLLLGPEALISMRTLASSNRAGPKSTHWSLAWPVCHREVRSVFLLVSYQILESYHTTNLKAGADDFFEETRHPGSTKPQPKPKVSDAIVLTTAIISARFFGGNQASAMLYRVHKQGLVMLEKLAFNRRLHRLATTLSALFYYLDDFFKALNLTSQYLIDSFPVSVCANIRISRSRLIKGEEYGGKVASKRRFFFGFRVQVVTSLDKQPVQFFILPGSYAAVTALQMIYLYLPAGSEVFGDSAYTDYEQEELYADCEQIYLQIQRKSIANGLIQVGWRLTRNCFADPLSRLLAKSNCGFPKRCMPLLKRDFCLRLSYSYWHVLSNQTCIIQLRLFIDKSILLMTLTSHTP